MPISPFIAKLRGKIGHDLLHLTGINAVVINNLREVLLVQPVDSAEWRPVGGMIEPGEEPADAAAREVFEETGVRVVPRRLVGVYDGPRVCYANGDNAHYITLVFLCRAVSGEPSAHDDENRDARYFPLDQLPELAANHRRNINDALGDHPEALFVFAAGKTFTE